MKVIVLLFLCTPLATAENRTNPATAVCGPVKVDFNVVENGALPVPPAPSDQARVFFIQDYGQTAEDQHYTLKVGVDGAWVGAYRNNSWLAISVLPGEHHICANVQSYFSASANFAFAHFTAEAGKTYYFRTRFLGGVGRPIANLTLDQPDSDEAKFLIFEYPAAVSAPKR